MGKTRRSSSRRHQPRNRPPIHAGAALLITLTLLGPSRYVLTVTTRPSVQPARMTSFSVDHRNSSLNADPIRKIG